MPSVQMPSIPRLLDLLSIVTSSSYEYPHRANTNIICASYTNTRTIRIFRDCMKRDKSAYILYSVPLAYILTYDTRIIRDHIRRYHMHIRIPSSCEYEYYMRIIYEYAYNSDTGILYFRSQILLLYSRHEATRQTCKLRHVLS